MIPAIGEYAVFKEGRVCHEDRQCRKKPYHIVPGGQMSQHTVGKHCVNLDKLGVNYTHDWKSAEEHILLVREING